MFQYSYTVNGLPNASIQRRKCGFWENLKTFLLETVPFHDRRRRLSGQVEAKGYHVTDPLGVFFWKLGFDMAPLASVKLSIEFEDDTGSMTKFLTLIIALACDGLIFKGSKINSPLHIPL